MRKKAKQVFWNAILLTGATLLMRTVGVSFQVLISNRAGAEAMGLFSLMSGVYGFALTLATSGIHLGVTHLVVDAVGTGQTARIGVAMRRAVCYALCFGCAASFLLIGFSAPIGTYWLKDARTVSSLRLLGITLPLIALSSVFGGYFTAVRRTYKNAAVQVAEQGFKIGFTMYLLAAIAGEGIEETCCALVLGGAIAEFLSFALELIFYLFDRRLHFYGSVESTGGGEGRRLMQIALPVAFTAYIRSGLITLEHILIPEGLRNSGRSHSAALATYGCIYGMALPVVLYPAALISSFSGLLIPELAESRVQGKQRHIRYMITRVWSLSMLFSIGVAGILICFSGEIGQALYPRTETGYYIRVLAPLIPIMYVDTATDAMLKGLGEQVYSMNVNILDALISVILVWLLIPHYGIMGYVVTIYFSEIFNTVFSIMRLLSVSHPPVRVWKWVFKPLLSVVGATVLSRAFWTFSGIVIANAVLSILLHCISALTLYIVFLRLTGGLDREDVTWIGGLFSKSV